MRGLMIAAVAAVLALCSPAEAHPDSGWMPDKPAAHSVKRSRHVVKHRRHFNRIVKAIPRARRGLVSISTAAGRITVAPSFAPAIRGFIADVVARGFKGGVHCYASGGHVAGSLHYSGRACDFAQRGWGLTVRPMYRVADLARKWGLRDGCTFRDCGHIDSGDRLTVASRRIRMARAQSPW